MWYEKAFRRHLCDMHIDDWNPEFLSRFSPEEYVSNLKLARVQNAMLYFQSHVGLCYYPTRSAKMHNAFVGREDAMRKTVDLCHRAGIAVTGYYSLIYNTWAHDNYPEWRMLGESGISKRVERCGKIADMDFADNRKTVRYGFCCPNNPNYRAFIKTQIEEMAEYFPDVEGMFYDMLFWPHMCYCKHCKDRWTAEVGGPLPQTEDWRDERWLLHIRKRREWMGEFAQWVTDLTKSFLPHVSVEHNVAYSAKGNPTVSNCEEVIAACDYAGGDLYGDLYNQSFACKFYQSITKNQPFEYMFSRCAPNLTAHTQIKSPDVMRSAIGLTASHHGATLVIDAIDPVGTMDRRVYEQMGKVFEEMIPYESCFKGAPMVDVGIYYSLKSKFDACAEGYTNYLGTVNTVKSMICSHVPCGITGSFSSLDGYQCIVASCLTEEDAYDSKRLIDHVKRGGTLYFSGGECHTLLREFFGAHVLERTKEIVTYLSPTARAQVAFGHYTPKYPLHFEGTAPLAEGIDPSFVWATLTLPYTNQHTAHFASIHSNPPGIATNTPAIACRSFGNGKVIWSALPIECVALEDYGQVLLSLLCENSLVPTLCSDAPDDVEITAFLQDDGLLLHTVQLNDARTARKLADFDISVTCKSAPHALLRLPTGEPIPFSKTDGRVTFTVHNPRIFETFKFIYE